MFPKACDEKVNKRRGKIGRSVISPHEKSTCAKCEKGHLGECLVRTGNCLCCAKSGNKVRDFINIKV